MVGGPGKDAGNGAETRQLLLGVAALEALHATAGVHELLLPRVERVAIRANLDVDLRLGCPRLERIPARTPHGGLYVLGMDPLLHLLHSSSFKNTRGRDPPSAPPHIGETLNGRSCIPSAPRPSPP